MKHLVLDNEQLHDTTQRDRSQACLCWSHFGCPLNIRVTPEQSDVLLAEVTSFRRQQFFLLAKVIVKSKIIYQQNL